MLNRSIIPAALAGLVLAFAAAPSSAPAQDLTRDEVLQQYYEAIGGLEQWQDVETMRATGQMTLPQGMTVPFRLYSKRPNKMRMEFDVQGMTGIQAFDGETAWMIMPFTGSSEPQEVPAVQAEELRRESDFDGPLMGWEEEGHEIELVGKETVDGTEAYRLDVTLQDGDVQHYFLDASAFVPIKVTGSRTIQGTTVEYSTDLGGYKAVDGLMMAHSIESQTPGAQGGSSITLDSVELGVTLADSLFAMPESDEGDEGDEGGSR